MLLVAVSGAEGILHVFEGGGMCCCLPAVAELRESLAVAETCCWSLTAPLIGTKGALELDVEL